MKKKPAPKKQGRTWDYATGVSDLVRHNPSGRYYARYQVAGRRKMKALKTAVWSVAKLRLVDELSKAERSRQHDRRTEGGNLLLGDLLDQYRDEYLANTARAARSKRLVTDTMARLTRQWEACFGNDFRATKPSKVSVEQIRKFSNYMHTDAVHRQNNARNSKRGYGAMTVNKTIELLHLILRRAVKAGVLMVVPFDLGSQDGESFRKPIKSTKLRLPSSAKMREVFAEMRRVPDALNLAEMREYLVERGEESAELAEFMAFSGARISEAVTFVWADDHTELIVIRGTKTEGSRDREVPKIPALIDLFCRMRARRIKLGRKITGRVFNIRQCREGLEAACKRAGVDRLTHHSLRHYFATICIEAGVDIPTISRWLGHADGGVLAMKTYGHLRNEHSLSAAQKVRF